MATVRELITRWGFEVDDAPLKRIDSGVKNITVSLGVMSVAFGAAGAAMGFFLNKAGDFEQTQIAFETMLGSVELAAKALDDIRRFTKTTPFELKDTLIGAKRLLAYNIEADKLIPTLTSLGNIAAGVGRERLPFLILALGQVKTATKLRGQELRQFTEAGVPLIGALAEQFGKKESEIFELISKGKVTFEDVEAAIIKMTTGSGKFANLMQKQSKTFLGMWSNIRDTLNLLAIDIGFKLLPVGKKYLKLTLDWLNANSKIITQRLDKFFKKFTIAVSGAAKVIKSTVGLAKSLADVFGGLEKVTVFLGKAFLITFGIATIAGVGQVTIGVFKLIGAFKKLGIVGLISNIKAFFIPILIGAGVLALLATFEELFSFMKGKKTLLEDFLLSLRVPRKDIDDLRISLQKLSEQLKGAFLGIFDNILNIFTSKKSKEQLDNIDKNIARVQKLTQIFKSLADEIERFNRFITGSPAVIKTNLGNVDAITGRGRKATTEEGFFRPGPFDAAESALQSVIGAFSGKLDFGAFSKDFFSFENLIKNSNIPNIKNSLFPPPPSLPRLRDRPLNIGKIEVIVPEGTDREGIGEFVAESVNDGITKNEQEKLKKAESSLATQTGQ